MNTNFLRSAKILHENISKYNTYPFSLPIIQKTDEIIFDSPITFIVGENGSGKSTLLEAIAIAYGFNPEGGSTNFRFSTKDTHSHLSDFLQLTKGFRHPENNFFLRAESFYNAISYLDEIEDKWKSYGGENLHEKSHGEAFFQTFLYRFSDNGFFVLDEPESALSPERQLGFLLRMQELVKKGSQFIIATHSPILMAFPGATIYEFCDNSLQKTEYKNTKHFRLYSDFLSHPEAYLRALGLCGKK